MNRYGRVLLSACFAWTLGATASLHAQPNAASAPSADAPSKRGTPAKAELSQAERILRLEQQIKERTRELTELKASLAKAETEYNNAKDDFARIDEKLKEREKELTSQPASSENQDILKRIQKGRELAKERFDLAIKAQDTLRAKYAALQTLLQQNQEALESLRSPASQPVASQPATPSLTATPVATPKDEAPVAPTKLAAPPQSQPASPTTALPGLPSGVGIPTPSMTTGATTGSEPAPSKEVLEARQKAQAKEIQVRKAETEAQSVSKRIETLRDTIKNEQDLLDTARKQAENDRKIYAAIREHIQRLWSEGASNEEINRFWNKAKEAEKRATDAENEVNKHITNLDQMKSDLLDLQAEQNAALKKLEQEQAESVKAQKQLESLTNPFAAHNVLQWLIDHGPRIIGIILGAFVLLWLSRIAENRIVRLMTISRTGDGSILEREARAKTLASVFKNFASTVIICGSILMILTEVELNIIPLLGGAAVFGLAVAFGAQSLIKDYFNGFMILLENQYAINDVVRIGDAAGVVERITLRMTVLRDMDGSAHFIPHGEVKKVTNLTHGWSRAVFNIGIAYKENVDQVMEVLMDLGRKMQRDPDFGPLILDAPEMLGVDQFADSAVVIKFLIKTRPLRQWAVKREMLRRIKNRFDELDIEIPFPHRVVFHRSEDTATPEDENSTS